MKSKVMWSTLVVGVMILVNGMSASIYDCWDPEKLSRMNFPLTQRESLFYYYICSNHDQTGAHNKLNKKTLTFFLCKTLEFDLKLEFYYFSCPRSQNRKVISKFN